MSEKSMCECKSILNLHCGIHGKNMYEEYLKTHMYRLRIKDIYIKNKTTITKSKKHDAGKI